MTITEFSIKFDRAVYYPGQLVQGTVFLSLIQPKNIKGVQLKIKGRTKFKWTESETYKNSEGKWETRTVTRVGRESYLKTTIALFGGKQLLAGVHTYPFAVMLPGVLPSTFHDKYGDIVYYAEAKVDIPLQVDRIVKNFFHVENLLDLNNFPELKTPVKREEGKTFCCFCCASGPLSLVAYVPKTGFSKNESIPITVEIDNASDVHINNVTAHLFRHILWKAESHTKNEKNEIEKLTFGEVPKESSKTWSKTMLLNGGPFPNIKNCNIITVSYELLVVADPSGAHVNLEIAIPLTIGDIPFVNSGNFPSSYPVHNTMTGDFYTPQQNNPNYFVPSQTIPHPPANAAYVPYVPQYQDELAIPFGSHFNGNSSDPNPSAPPFADTFGPNSMAYPYNGSNSSSTFYNPDASLSSSSLISPR